jgi:hypothetical protein
VTVSWFKVDDNLAFHPKAVMATNPALGLWVRAGSWAAQQLTDGFVPLNIARSLGSAGQADRLITAGLWLPCGEGYEFHQWAERQPTRKIVEERRAANAERLRLWRERREADS